MDSWLQKSGYALLCPAPPSSLPHTHTATGNKTVTYDFAPIISQERVPRFSPGAKERGQNNQRLSCAELSLGSTWTPLCVPPEPLEYSLPAKLLSPKCDGHPGAFFFGPSQSQGREERGSPKGFPSTNPTDLPGRADRYFPSATTFCCEIQRF